MAPRCWETIERLGRLYTDALLRLELMGRGGLDWAEPDYEEPQARMEECYRALRKFCQVVVAKPAEEKSPGPAEAEGGKSVAEGSAKVPAVATAPEPEEPEPQEKHGRPDHLIKEESRWRRKGKYDRTEISTWRIWFQGVDYPMPEWVGTEYLIFLIERQGREYDADDLTTAVRKSRPSGGVASEQQAKDMLLGEGGDSDSAGAMRGRVGALTERDDIWDADQIQTALRKKEKLEEEIAKHEAARDYNSKDYLDLKGKLEEQLDLLKANAKRVMGKSIPKEYQKGTFQKKANLIGKHFLKLLNEHLRENCRPLFDHLRDPNTLTYGMKNCYQPKPRVDWKIQRKGDKKGT